MPGATNYAEWEHDTLRSSGFSLLSLQGKPTPGVGHEQSMQTATDEFRRLGLPVDGNDWGVRLQRVRKRPVGRDKSAWERLCWIGRFHTVTIRHERGRGPRLVLPEYARWGIVMVDAERGVVVFSGLWE